MGADLGGALLRVAKRRAPLLMLELVGLVEQPVHAHVGAARHEYDESLVGGHEGTAGIHHDDSKAELNTCKSRISRLDFPTFLTIIVCAFFSSLFSSPICNSWQKDEWQADSSVPAG